MIGLFGSSDGQVNRIKQFLPEDSYVHIDTESFPESQNISILDGDVTYSGVDNNISVYYVDSYHSSVKRPINKEDEESDIEVNRRFVFATAEKDSFLRSLLKIEQEQGKKVINRPDIKDFHYLKPYQLFKLQRKGLPVPDSVHTNDPDIVRELFQLHDKLVYKPVGSLSRVGAHNLEEFEARKDTLAHAPVTFQELCEGDNIRVYVLDGKVIGCYKILTDTNVVDYRGFESSIEQIAVTDHLAHISIKSARVLDMHFAGIDVIRNDGRVVILECNSAPHFAGVEDRIDSTNISQALANYLQRHNE